MVPRHADGLPVTSQFFFSHLDFARCPAGDGTLRGLERGQHVPARRRRATDLFMAVRPDGDGLRVNGPGLRRRVHLPPALDCFVRSWCANPSGEGGLEPPVRGAPLAGRRRGDGR
ncbi:hypothetical protein GCM10023238_39410 [Streptomyces heliomycini]